MKDFARGYIASGVFNGCRAPQHLQNQIIKLYCDTNELQFVLSRAEYWINGSTRCQLWAALNEGYRHIVFFSLWQLPNEQNERCEIYAHCKKNNITLHFATERISLEGGNESFEDLEILIQSNLLILNSSSYRNNQYLDLLGPLIQE